MPTETIALICRNAIHYPIPTVRMSHMYSPPPHSPASDPSLLLPPPSSDVFLSYCTACTLVFHSSHQPTSSHPLLQLPTTWYSPLSHCSSIINFHVNTCYIIKETHIWLWSNCQPPHRTTTSINCSPLTFHSCTASRVTSRSSSSSHD